MDWNEIKSCRDFARYLNIPYKHLTYLLYNRKIDKLYESFEIPQKKTAELGLFRLLKKN